MTDGIKAIIAVLENAEPQADWDMFDDSVFPPDTRRQLNALINAPMPGLPLAERAAAIRAVAVGRPKLTREALAKMRKRQLV